MTEAESFRYYLGNAKAIECLQNALVFVGSRLKFVFVAGFHVGLAAGDFARADSVVQRVVFEQDLVDC